MFWREYGWQTRLAELHNGGRSAESVSRQAVHVLDGNRRERDQERGPAYEGASPPAIK